MKTHRTKHNVGSALLEVLIASVVLSIGILSALSLSLQTKKYELTSQQINHAVICAQSQLENIRIKPYADILAATNSALIDASLCDSIFTPTAEKLTTSNNEYQPIRVTVSWENKHNLSQNIALTTIITNTSAADGAETIIANPISP